MRSVLAAYPAALAVGATLLCVANLTMIQSASAQQVYDDPAAVGARFIYDRSVWDERPTRPGFGMILRCRGSGCGPEVWVAPGSCQIAFSSRRDARWNTIDDFARTVDLRVWLRMRVGMLAAPLDSRGVVREPVAPCRWRADTLCATAALERPGSPGVGYVFVTVRNGFRIDGSCAFFAPMLSEAEKHFEAIVKGVIWETNL